MQKRLSWVLAGAASLVVCSLQARTAQAAPPGNWSIGVERLFGISRVTSETEVGNTTVSNTATSVSLFSAFSGQRGYSSPRLAFDYIATSGITFGGAFAYETVSREGVDDDQSEWLLAGRIGFFALPSPNFAVWPRAGLTHIAVDTGGNDDDDVTATAITLEVPLVIMVLGRSVGITITPHADIGIAGGTDTVDRTLTELGLQFGANAFF
jgi:hypothetical protein